jgi:hypothetical protein
VHPYPNPNAAGDSPDVGYVNPNNYGIPNLDRVEQAVWDGFHGTGQLTTLAGLRLVVDETGWQTAPDRPHRRLYSGKEVTRTVSPAKQGGYVARAIGHYLACDPAVSDILFFHLIDESDLGRFQSGLMYANGDRKSSFGQVQHAIAAGCAGLRIAWAPGVQEIGGTPPLLLELAVLQSPPVVVPSTQTSVSGGLKIALGAALAESARAEAELVPFAGGDPVAHREFLARAGVPVALTFRGAIPAGRYRVVVKLSGVAQGGLTASKTLVTKPFRVR